jgi:hypothetical protein
LTSILTISFDQPYCDQYSEQTGGICRMGEGCYATQKDQTRELSRRANIAFPDTLAQEAPTIRSRSQ